MRVLLNNTAVVAAAACLGLISSSANAADFGGGCCADLEERVAELEATAARKGNRVVSLAISGQISKGLLIWDDGIESDAFVVDNAISTSQFNLIGSAQIRPGTAAGYHMAVDVNDSLSVVVNQDNDEGQGDVLSIRLNNVWIQDDRLGKVTIGQGYSFIDAVSVPFQLGNTHNTDGTPYAAGFRVRSSDGGFSSSVTWGRLVGDGPRRGDYLRYDSPAFGGFTFTGLVGEDDTWEVGAKYFQTLGRVRLHTAITYYSDDEPGQQEPTAGFLSQFDELKGLLSIKDGPTGLFLTVWAAQREYQRNAGELFNAGADFEDTGHSIQAFLGVEQNFTGYGNTTIYGGYGQFNDMAGTGLDATGLGLDFGGDEFVADADVDRITFGIVQTFDAAALDVYAIAEHYSADITVGDISGDNDAAAADVEDFSAIIIGSRIKF